MSCEDFWFGKKSLPKQVFSFWKKRKIVLQSIWTFQKISALLQIFEILL